MMKNRQIAMGLAAGMVGLVCSQAWADVSVERQRDVYAIDHPVFRIEVEAAGGGRIRSWILKPSGRELIALWKDGNEIGGALDDRSVFTAARYEASIMQRGPKVVVLRLEANDRSGLSVIKTLSVSEAEPVVRVRYQFRNGGQAPAALWIRSFLLPGSRPQTESHLYWVNGRGVRDGRRAEGTPRAAHYYTAEQPEYAALWDKTTGDGVCVYAPGVERFYFWRGSERNPTFEWIYPELPPGRVLSAEVAIAAISGQTRPPRWDALVQHQAGSIRRLRTSPLAGWIDEPTRFGVTEQEREAGFWLSIGRGDAKRRLPASLPVDLAMNDQRHVAIAVNVLKDMHAPVRVEVPGAWRDQIEARWETAGVDRLELLPLPESPVRLRSGSEERLWLRVGSRGKPAGEYRVPLVISVGRATQRVLLAVHVWPVHRDTGRPFHVRGYCGGFTVWTGGYEVLPEKLGRLDAILAAYAAIGGDVLDWNAVWARIIPHVKIARGGRSLAEVAKNAPETLDLDRLPQLDFSYFDPWLEAAKRHGVTRVETYMMHPGHPQLGWRLLTPAVGRGRVQPGTPEARRVVVWFYAEMKRWFQSHGFHGFFAKVSDEISPEDIPRYLEAAEVAREAGWRPFTTITGMIARTASLLEQMDPLCDQWQLSFGLKDDFLSLLERKFTLVEKRIVLAGRWAPYRNGGAENTWALRVFGKNSATGIRAADVETFELREDGKPLKHKGGSPWGNRRRGIVCTAGSLKTHLYVSPFDGSDPNGHKYELVVTLRQPSADGNPLVRIDATDEIWCYGGSSRPFRRPYDSSWVYPVMALVHEFDGYGLWAFYHWNKTERILWIDERTHRITVSPVYCGYRDGWRDALLFAQLARAAGRKALESIVGESEKAILRVGPKSREVYRYRTVLNAADPLARNRARALALRRLGGS